MFLCYVFKSLKASGTLFRVIDIFCSTKRVNNTLSRLACKDYLCGSIVLDEYFAIFPVAIFATSMSRPLGYLMPPFVYPLQSHSLSTAARV